MDWTLHCTVDNIETELAKKARPVWVLVHDAPLDRKVDKLISGAAFVCLDICKPFDHKL